MLPFRRYGAIPDELPLRERKMAQARLDVLDAFLAMLAERPATDIQVREICKKAQVSEPGFYNHFPEKDHLFLFFIQIWSVDMALRLQKRRGVDAIRRLFRETASMNDTTGRLLLEVIAFQARRSVPELLSKWRPLNRVEKLLVFGDAPFDDLPDTGLGPLLQKAVSEAIHDSNQDNTADGNLRADAKTIALSLSGLFFGLPVAMQGTGSLSKAYDRAILTFFPLNDRRTI